MRRFTNIDKNTKRTNIKGNRYDRNTKKYFIASRKADAKFFNHALREHWGIENKLHQILDVAFGEDASNKRAGNAAENFSFISKVALNLLNHYDDRRGAKKISMKTKRRKCGWSNDIY